MNVVIIFKDPQLETIQKFTFNPFKKNHLENLTATDNNLFYNKAQNLYGSTIRLGQYENPPYSFVNYTTGKTSGIDGMAFTEICKHMNASYSLIKPPNDETISGPNLLFTNEADISFNMHIYISRDYLNPYLDDIHHFSIASYALMIPTANEISPAKTLTDPFRIEVWIALWTMVLIFLVIWWIIQRKSRSFRDTFVNTMFLMCLFSSLNKISRTYIDKTIVIGFILSNFLVFTSYQSVLTSFLMKERYETDINTFAEINQTNIYLVIHPAMMGILRATNKRLPNLSNKIIERDDSIWSAKNDKDPLKGYIILSIDIEPYKHSEANIIHGRPILQPVKERLLYSTCTFLATKNSIYTEEFDRILTLFGQAGLFQHFKTMGYMEAIEKKLIPQVYSACTSNSPIDLDSISPLVFYLLLGYIVGLITFVIEVFMGSFTR